MVKLDVTAPGKQKLELECEPSTSFGDIRAQIATALGAPPEKLRILCNKKERKSLAETLAAAGVDGTAKVMIMLVPGYSLPAKAAAESEPAAPDAEAEVEELEKEGELAAQPGAETGAEPGLVVVRHGRARYRMRVPQGLPAATFGQLAAAVFPLLPGSLHVPAASELVFLTRGRRSKATDSLGAGRELSVILLLARSAHDAADGAEWLRERLVELAATEAEVAKLRKRVEANLAYEEERLRLSRCEGELANMDAEKVKVAPQLLDELREFHKRVQAAMKETEELRRRM